MSYEKLVRQAVEYEEWIVRDNPDWEETMAPALLELLGLLGQTPPAKWHILIGAAIKAAYYLGYCSGREDSL